MDDKKAQWEARPKCKNHPRSIATKKSIAEGFPLCHFCDPKYEPPKPKLKKNRRLGARKEVMPASMLDHYEAAILDEHTVELKEDIAVTEARLQVILRSIKDNPMESSGFITFFNKSFKKQLNLVKRGMLSYPEFISAMNALLDGKVSEIMAYQEFYRVTDMKRKLVETETSRTAKLGWTPNYVCSLIVAMTRILKDMLPADQVTEFQGRLSQDPVFHNKAFNILPPAKFTTQEEFEATIMEDRDGIYEVSYDNSREDGGEGYGSSGGTVDDGEGGTG